MKRVISLCIVFLLLLTTACTSKNNKEVQMFPSPLTFKQEELLSSVLTNTQDSILLDFCTESDCTSVDFWVEQYVDGVIIEGSIIGLSLLFNDQSSKKNGTICFIFDKSEIPSISFILTTENEKISSYKQISFSPLDKTAFGFITENQTLSYNKDFTIGYILFGFSDTNFSEDMQQLDNAINSSESALLFRCRYNS